MVELLNVNRQEESSRRGEDCMHLQRLLHKHEALLADFSELRTDFDILVRCLEGQNILVDKHLRKQRAVRAGATLEGVLQHQTLATRIFASAGQITWSSSRRASMNSYKNATAVQKEKVMVVGGLQVHSPKTRDDFQKSFEVLDVHSGKWEAVRQMYSPRVAGGAAVLGGYLYVCGGWIPTSQSVSCYHPAKESWTPMPNLKAPRNYCAVAAMDHYLYVLGGQDSTQAWNSVERLNPNDKDHQEFEWVLPGMREHRRSAAAATLNHRIYVCGGCDKAVSSAENADLDVARSAEVFSPATGEFGPLPKMNVPRNFHCAAAVKDKVIITGGSIPGKQRSVDSVEVYEPLAMCWTLILSMNMMQKRGGHITAFAAGKLYIVGGNSEDRPGCVAERSLQRLDLQEHKWEKQEPMSVMRSCPCGAVLTMGPGASD